MQSTVGANISAAKTGMKYHWKTPPKPTLANIQAAHSEEANKKRSVTLRNYWKDKNRTISPKTATKISQTLSQKYASGEIVPSLTGRFGNTHPAFGNKHTVKHKKKMSTRMAGVNNPMYGVPLSDIAKRNLRVVALQRMLEFGILPVIGRNEKYLLDKQEQMDNVTILHQYRIWKLGYITDGYCIETNTVYEVYEKKHLRLSVKKRDAIRQKEIEEYLGCKFVIIWDK